jgi:hypothetical protein
MAGPESAWPRKINWLGQHQPGLEKKRNITDGAESDWPSNMQNNIRSACRRENGHRKQKQRGGGRCTWRGGGGAVVEAGGGVVAHGRWLQAATLLFQAAKREILPLPFSRVFFPILLFF